MASELENEIKKWLKVILVKEKLVDFSVNIEGNTEKGDNYLGDIYFLKVVGETENKIIKNYDLAMKCSKRNKVLRETTPMQSIFENEIYVYQHLFPAFTEFQRKKGVQDIFDSYAKFYGSFIENDVEIIVLDNLKKKGYGLWDRKTPMPFEYIERTLEGYAKWHAISMAMQDQEPENFNQLASKFTRVYEKMLESGKFDVTFEKAVQTVYDLLKNELDEDILVVWKNLIKQVRYIFYELVLDKNCQQVINHGDCWNNNFMFQVNRDPKNMKIAILDWQLAKLGSPILDLSYYLFSTISEQDINATDDLLKKYHTKLQEFITKLGSDANKCYPYGTFLKEWRKYGRYGATMTSVILKICTADKNEAPDLTESAKNGLDMSDAFDFEVKDVTRFKARMKYIVPYVVKKDLII